MNQDIKNKNDKKLDKESIIRELIIYVCIILAIVLIRTFIITPIRVSGPSMEDTLNNGQIVLLKKIDKSYDRFDIVIFNYKDEKLIKRVIALPGETIRYKDNILYINDVEIEDFITIGTNDFGPVTLNKDEYFVLGDNRGVSLDSRKIGVINKKRILGTTDFSIFPFNKLGFFK